MRVSTSWMQQQSVGSMMDRQSDLSDINTQLSTGKRINQPSDDPVGAARALDLSHLHRRHRAVPAQHHIRQRAAGAGRPDAVDISNVLERVRTLAAAGHQRQPDSTATRGDIAAEMVQLR